MKKIYTSFLALTMAMTFSSTINAQINIDGTFTDWDAYAFTKTATTSATQSISGMKTYADATNIYVYYEGTNAMSLNNFDFFMNADNNPSTGFLSGDYPNGSGADYLFQGGVGGGLIYTHTGGSGFSWNQIAGKDFSTTLNFSAVVTNGTKNKIEFSIKKSDLTFAAANVTIAIIEVTSGNRTATMPFSEFGASYANLPLAGGTLPVSFLMFDGKIVNEGVKLNWSTSSEINNSHFEILKSLDGKLFSSIATVNGNVNSANQNFYSYVDKNVAPSVSYYELKQYDLNGKATSLKTISITTSFDALSLKVFKNDNANELEVSIYSPVKQTSVFTLTDVLGRIIISKTLELAAGNQQFKIASTAKSGLNIGTLSSNKVIISQKYMFE